MAATNNGQAQSPSSWDDSVGEMRDLGLKYMNAALNAAGNQSGGITRNVFNMPATTPAASNPSPSAGVAPAVSGFLSSPIAKGIMLGLGGPALLAAGSLLPAMFNKPAAAPVSPPAATAPDQNIGVKADLLIDPPPGATQ